MTAQARSLCALKEIPLDDTATLVETLDVLDFLLASSGVPAWALASSGISTWAASPHLSGLERMRILDDIWKRACSERRLDALRIMMSRINDLPFDEHAFMQRGLWLDNYGICPRNPFVAHLATESPPDCWMHYWFLAIGVSPLRPVWGKLPISHIVRHNRNSRATVRNLAKMCAFERLLLEYTEAQQRGWSPERHCYFSLQAKASVERALVLLAARQPLGLIFRLCAHICADDVRDQLARPRLIDGRVPASDAKDFINALRNSRVKQMQQIFYARLP